MLCGWFITSSIYGLDLHCICMVLCYMCMVRAMLVLCYLVVCYFFPMLTSVWYLGVLLLVNSLCSSQIALLCHFILGRCYALGMLGVDVSMCSHVSLVVVI